MAQHRRRVVAEVGDHLRDLASEARARGLGEHDAELEAVDRFGSPRTLASGLRPARRIGAPARILGGVAAVACCAALVLTFANPGTESPRALEQSAGRTASSTNGVPAWCIVAIDTVQRAELQQHRARVAIRGQLAGHTIVAIDPRTGTILSWGNKHGEAGSPVCHVRPARATGGGFSYVVPDPAAPFG